MQIRTDLAMESREWAQSTNGVSSCIFRHGMIEEVHVSIETEEAAKLLSKACGKYITLSHPVLSRVEMKDRRRLSSILCDTLRGMLPPFGDILIVGLGNRHITADALGSKVLDRMLITRHMKGIEEPDLQGKLRGVCAVSPGVLGITGIETAEMVKGIIEKVHPSAVIAIDALAARASSRICTTIQITDTGIRPGSGVGNHRMGLTRDTMGVPVIAIGVPMVVYAAVIAKDAISMLMEDAGMQGDEHENAVDALIEKIENQGLGEMVVTPREVDELVGKVAEVIAMGLNMALQTKLTEEEIEALSHDLI